MMSRIGGSHAIRSNLQTQAISWRKRGGAGGTLGMTRAAQAQPSGRGPASLQKLVESEVARITPIIEAAGVEAN